VVVGCSFALTSLRLALVGRVVAMGERRVASVVPPRVSPLAGRRAASRADIAVPVVDLLPLPRVGVLQYGMGRVDVHGAVSNRPTIEALGWRGGDRLQISLIAGSVVVHRDPRGAFTMPHGRYLVLPAAVRHHSGLHAGEQMLLAADPGHDVLVLHPLRAVDTMVLAYHAGLGGEPR
jgi:hypothetical protein